MTVVGISQGPQWSHWSRQFRGERPTDDPTQLEIWGYAGKPSYAPGETLTLHVSTTAQRFAVLIYRDGGARELVHRADGLTGSAHATPEAAYAVGCGWPSSVSIDIPASWRPGAYVVEFTASDERGSATQDGFFVLRPSEQGSGARIAVVVATYTWQAYNDWGGASAYSRDPASGESMHQLTSVGGFSPRLSSHRPWARGLIRLPSGAPRIAMKHPPSKGWAPRREQAEWAFANGYSYWSGSAGWAGFDSLFVRWAERNGYAFDVLTQWDLDRDPRCLAGYACVVTVGHDEYWTATGRAALDRFIENGGSYARFAGNIFWQIRLEDGGQTQVCYKYVAEADPLAEADERSLRTGMFESQAIANPPVTTFGANGGRGVYSRMGGSAPRGVGGFIVYKSGHWVFESTDLYYGDVLGGQVPLVGYESDGVSYTFENGLPVPTGEDGAPAGLEILALTPVTAEEENHAIPGGFLEIEDRDLGFFAHAVLGADDLEARERLRRGSAVITWMKKGAGEVVCCGSTEWPYALAQSEPMAEQIVQNVLDRFSRAASASSGTEGAR